MFTDAATEPAGQDFHADLCIVGAGAAGISLALQFLDEGRSVLLVEAGGEVLDAPTQDLYKGEVADEKLHSPLHRYRQRMYGGSTTIWGGRCVQFDPIDFERRDWVADSGWPISYQDVARYYPAATELSEAGDPVYDARAALPEAMQPMIRGFAPDDFTLDTIERFSCPTDFGARYRQRLADSAKVRVLLNANCTEIVTAADGGSVDHLVLRRLGGGAFRVFARDVVIAMGGLETARLLLSSRGRDPRGVGNAHDLVGRHYMCHIAGTFGDLSFALPREAIHYGYQRAWDGVYCRRRIQPTDQTQRRLGIGNVAMRLHHPRLPDPAHRNAILSTIYFAKPFIAYEYATRLHGHDKTSVSQLARHAANLLRDPFAVARFLTNWLWVRTLAARKFPSLIIPPKAPLFSLDINAEQSPNPLSRVTLADGPPDALGQPRLHVDWRYTPSDIDTVKRALAALRDSLRHWGKGQLDYDPDQVEFAMLREGGLGGHHIGLTRMGRTPEQGVTDRDCRVFGMDNLYIAGSAVFPTSSHANPTLTIIALVLRLADHLKGRAPGGTVGAGSRA
jgi:choline dehydrogenase-like flavoprotein